MRVPISWLREFVDVPADVTHEQVHAALVRVGFEEEDVHDFGVSGPIVVGQVLEFTPEPQANGKTINWCQVDVGESEGVDRCRLLLTPANITQRVMAALSMRSEQPLSFEREAANERETHGLNPLKHSFSPLVTEITVFCRKFFNTMIRHALRYMSVFSACF